MNYSITKYRLAVLTSHPIQYQGPFFKALAQSGEVELTVYFASDAGRNQEMYDPEFKRNIKWDIPLLEGYRYEFLKNIFALPAICLRKRKKYDAIIVFGWNSFAHFLVFLAAFLSKTPVLLRGENPLHQEVLKSRGVKLKIKKIFFHWLFKKISGFLYIGDENRKFYAYYGASAERMFFTPYAVDNDRFITEAKKLLPRKNELKKELGIAPEKIVILFVGKLISKKRPMDLLHAYELLITQLPNYQLPILLFVGDGALRPELENYVKTHNLENVLFVGFKNQTEVSTYYACSDIFVLASGIGETWGLVVNEAMCFGLPIIASDIVGCGTDLAMPGENGYIFSCGDVKKLADYVKELIENKEKRETFGKKSFEIVQNYSYKEDIKAIIQFLQKHE